MADNKTAYPYDEMTQPMVALESGYFMDYAKPPYVDRKWINEGDEFLTTEPNAEVIETNYLAVPKSSKRLPKIPEGLNCSTGAYILAEKNNLVLVDSDVIGTGRFGQIVVNDILRMINQRSADIHNVATRA